VEKPEIRLRGLLGQLAAGALCTWTGYFLVHTNKTWEPYQLALVGLGALAAYCGSVWAWSQEKTGRFGWLMLLMGLLAVGVGDIERPWAVAPAVAVCLVGGIRARVMPGTLGVRFVMGWLFGAAFVFTGFATAPSNDQEAIVAGCVLAAYVGLAESVRGARAISRGAFSAVMGAMIGGLLLFAAVALSRPYGLISAVLAVYLGLRIALYGRGVLARCTAVRLGVFAETTLAAFGFFAAAVLIARAPGERQNMNELIWPIVAAAVSVVLVRFTPRWDTEEEHGDDKGEGV